MFVEEKLQTMGVAVWFLMSVRYREEVVSELGTVHVAFARNDNHHAQAVRLNTEALSSEQLQEAAQMANVPLEQYVHSSHPKTY